MLHAPVNAHRVGDVREVVSRAGAHGALLTSLPDIRWVTGFTGSNGVLLITAERALLLTDPRYEEQVRREVTVVDTESVSGSLLTAAAQTIEGPRSFELLVDSRSLTLEGAEQLNAVGNGAVTLRPEPGILDSLRCRKSDEEIRSIRRAQFITDEVFGELLDTLKPGMSERHVAAEIVYRHMRRGAERMSFEPIVASGPNGALPHARPSNRILAAGDLVVIDMGCVANGYVSDMTRTVAIGSASSKQQEAY
ncbi:MAG: aminopeptidase P family protein, partial [Bacteroidetes bacterium]|nr:aminopeptidase P family protein [Bacteroidota bacterium]